MKRFVEGEDRRQGALLPHRLDDYVTGEQCAYGRHAGVVPGPRTQMQARLDRMPDAMGVRRQTVEHPFGTIKAWVGSTHFLTRTLKGGQHRNEPPRPGIQY